MGWEKKQSKRIIKHGQYSKTKIKKLKKNPSNLIIKCSQFNTCTQKKARRPWNQLAKQRKIAKSKEAVNYISEQTRSFNEYILSEETNREMISLAFKKWCLKYLTTLTENNKISTKTLLLNSTIINITRESKPYCAHLVCVSPWKDARHGLWP